MASGAARAVMSAIITSAAGLRNNSGLKSRLPQSRRDRETRGADRGEQAAQQAEHDGPGDRAGEELRGDAEGEGDLAEGLPVDRRGLVAVEGDVSRQRPDRAADPRQRQR